MAIGDKFLSATVAKERPTESWTNLKENYNIPSGVTIDGVLKAYHLIKMKDDELTSGFADGVTSMERKLSTVRQTGKDYDRIRTLFTWTTKRLWSHARYRAARDGDSGDDNYYNHDACNWAL